MAQQPFNPPPAPTSPERAPWEEVREVTRRLDRLIALMERGIAPPGGPGVVLLPGAPGSTQQLSFLIQQLVPETMGASHIIPFQKTVAVSFQDEQERQVPITGIIRDVIMGFPAGCQQLVEVRLIYSLAGGGRSYIVPTVDNSFVALDDVTVVFQPRFPVRAPGVIKVEWWNYDSLNTHSVPVIITVVPTGLEVK